MSKTEFLEERIAPMAEACRPLKVRVTLRHVKDKYYIHFDGSKTYADNKCWERYWSGFNKYVKNMLQINGFKADAITLKTESYAVCFIGTLFDFLIQAKEDE